MSFISGALDKSVFNKNTFMAAIGDTKSKDSKNGYAVVRITPKYARLGTAAEDIDRPIVGVFNTAKGEYSFNIDSTWESMGGIASSILGGLDIVGAYQKFGDAASLAGGNLQGEVYASKKIFRKSNYMTMKIPLMVVDWDGTGQPVMSALMLAYYCLPSAGNLTEKTATIFKDFADQQVEKMQESENDGIRIVGKFIKATGNVAEGVINLVQQGLEVAGDSIGKIGGDYGKSNITEDINLITTLRASPVPVIVEIGNFFKHEDMVIEGLEYTFSKEMTRSGPLYMEASLNLSTRKILSTPEDIGLSIPSTSRFFQNGGSLIGG